MEASAAWRPKAEGSDETRHAVAAVASVISFWILSKPTLGKALEPELQAATVLRKTSASFVSKGF